MDRRWSYRLSTTVEVYLRLVSVSELVTRSRPSVRLPLSHKSHKPRFCFLFFPTRLMWVKYSIVDDTLAVRRVQSPSHPRGVVCGARQLKLGLSSRLPSLGLTSWTWPTDLMLGTCAAVTKGQVWWRPCEMILSFGNGHPTSRCCPS